MATSCGFESHRPHQRPIENGCASEIHLHAPSRTNHHRTRLTFDALAAGKPGAPLGLLVHDAVAVVGASGCGDRRLHLVDRLGRRHWLGACHAVAIAWSVDQFLDIVSLLRRIGAN